MLTPTKTLLRKAQSEGYALGAFNVYNLEGILAVVHAAEAEHSPALIQIHPQAFDYGGIPLLMAARSAAEEASAPMSVHLDHSTSRDLIRSALNHGVSSIMADGSDLAYEKNISFTKEMANLAHANGASVEAELGKISGTEDGLTTDVFEAKMTIPEQAIEFVRETNVDALAVCIGNVHGQYSSEPHLDFERLEKIKNYLNIPLVLHGTSGLPASMIHRSIELGVCKFNINTEMRMAYLASLRKLHKQLGKRELLYVMNNAVTAMQEVVSSKLHLFGSTKTTRGKMDN